MNHPIPSMGPARLGLSIVLLSLFTGCATPVFYNESRDKQGQDAKAAAVSVDFRASFDQLQGKFDALAALEAENLKARSALSRDLVFRELAMPPNQFNPASTVRERYVARLLDLRLKELGDGGTVDPAVDELRRQATSKLRVLSVALGAPVESCAAADEEKKSRKLLAKLPAVRQAGTMVLLNDAVVFCGRLVRPETSSTPTVAQGEIADLRRELKQAQDDIAHRRTLLKEKRSQLEAAAEKVDPGPSDTERLQAAAAKLQSLLDGVRTVGDLVEARAIQAAEASIRFDAIDQILKALSSGTTDLDSLDDKQRRAVLVARFVPSLTDEINKWMNERQRVRMAPLLLAKENQRLIVAGYETELQVRQQRTRTLARMLASTEAEHLALSRAKEAIGTSPKMLDAPLSGMLEGSGPDRFQLFTSLTRFDEAEEHRLDASLARLQLDASASDQALVASRSAAAQWSHLSNSIAAVLADFHAQGLKPGELAEFLKAFGVIGIAAK